jgi:PAS domain S-box-containing protein
VNPEELRIFGYSEAQMLGKRATEFIVMQETAQRAIEQKVSGAKELKPFMRTFKRADGTPLPMILLDRHMKDKDGRVVGLRTVMTPAPETKG